jgi:hypothetical protein
MGAEAPTPAPLPSGKPDGRIRQYVSRWMGPDRGGKPADRPPESEIGSDVLGMRWVKDHIQEVVETDAQLFGHAEIIAELASQMDEQMHVSDRTHLLESGVYRAFCDAMNIDYNDSAVIFLETLLSRADAAMGRLPPQHDWADSMAEQAKRVEDETSLVHRGGVYSFKVYPNSHPDGTQKEIQHHGVMELQQGLAQEYLDVVSAVAKFATNPLPYCSDPPDPSGREDLKREAHTIITQAQRARNGGDPLTWQRQEHLHHIYRSYSDTLQVRDPTTSVRTGKISYRDIPTNPETEQRSLTMLPVRVYTECSDGTTRYADIPIHQLLDADPTTLESGILARQRGTDGKLLDTGEWKTTDTIKTNQTEPAFSISFGHGPTKQSEIFRHGRSGDAIIHLHYNTDDGLMTKYVSHLRKDGMLAKAETFGLARAVHAYGRKNSEKIDVYPPTQPHEEPHVRSIRDKLLWAEKHDESLLDLRKDVAKLLKMLGNSDISIAGRVPEEEMAVIQSTAQLIDSYFVGARQERLMQYWFKKYPVGTGEKGGRAEKFILKRLAGTADYTANQFIGTALQMIAGTTVECGQAHTPAMGVVLASYPQMPQEVQQKFLDYMATGMIQGANRPRMLFLGEERTTLEKAFQHAVEVNGIQKFLLSAGITPIPVLHTAVHSWRSEAEGGGKPISQATYFGTRVSAETSYIDGLIADGVNGFTDIDEADWIEVPFPGSENGRMMRIIPPVAIEQFESASTSDFEEEFFFGSLGMASVKDTNGKTINTLHYVLRTKMTPQLLNALPLSGGFAERRTDEHFQRKVLPEIVTDPVQRERIRTSVYTNVASAWQDAYYRLRTELNPKRLFGKTERRPSNQLILAELLASDPRFATEDYRLALDVYLVTGLYDYQDRFFRTTYEFARATDLAARSGPFKVSNAGPDFRWKGLRQPQNPSIGTD